MILRADIHTFIRGTRDNLTLDVRSPSEYRHAHIPGAVNLPLFSDEERAIVGTAYKQQSRETAVKLGLDFFGPKMRHMVEVTEQWLCDKYPLQSVAPSDHTIYLYCWRGGMRSAGVAWLLDLYGFKVVTLEGGYKAFRNFILGQFEREDLSIHLLGGYTGSGKTQILHEMAQEGENVIDLEGIACHKGSAFGNLGMPEQPSQEMFENFLGMEIFRRAQNKRLIWMEDESQRLGHVNIPNALWHKMEQAPVRYIQLPFEERLERILAEYSHHDVERMIHATQRIQKRLGGLDTKNTIQHFRDGNIREAFRILLRYYERQYDKSREKSNS